jgi:hypothetical protein
MPRGSLARRTAIAAMRAATCSGVADTPLRPQVLVDVRALPPDAGGAAFTPVGEAVAVEARAHEARPPAVERIAAQERERGGIGVEQLLDEAHEPALVTEDRGLAVGDDRDRERQEPHQPVEAQVIGRPLARAAAHVAGLALELVLAPSGCARDRLVLRALDHDLVAAARHAAERAVGADQMQRVPAVVHLLMLREQVQRRLDAEQRGDAGEHVERGVECGRTRRELGRSCEPERGIRERREPEDHGEPVQPGVVAAHDQHELLGDDEDTRDRGGRLRREQRERHCDLHGVAECNACTV